MSSFPDTSTEPFQRLALGLAQIGRQHPYIGLTDPDAIRENLINRSLVVLPLLDVDRPVLDVGSGVGIPGLPLGLAEPSLSLTLLEPRQQCIALIRWLLSRFKELDLNPSLLASSIEEASLPGTPGQQVLTRAALDWSTLTDHLPETYGPIIRWSGPDVPDPPTRTDWTHIRLDCSPPCLSEPQQLLWWGPTDLFHVKQSSWSDSDWIEPSS